MLELERLKRSPIAITLAGWALFYSWLFSMVGFGLLIVIVVDLAENQELAERFAIAMSAQFGLTALVSCVVYLWALGRWARHLLDNARRYRLVDIALAPIVGLALAGTIVFLLRTSGAS